ncbi:MAG: metallophosphoesterase family protein [Gammaproteobacteria bacterium]
MLAGIISDTHGLLRPEARDALQGCDTIIHAGDIGKPEVLDGLRAIAPLTVIRGNVDKWAHDLPDTDVVEMEGRRIYIIHNVRELDFDPRQAGFDAVISGHSHKPGIREEGGVLYLNPGSAGPRRFRLPVALARLTVSREKLEAKIIYIEQ